MHVWVTFDVPKRVDVMKGLADHSLKKAALERKAGGERADGFVEVQPKGVGQQVCALPFGRASIRMTLNDDDVIRETVAQATMIEHDAGTKRGRKSTTQSTEKNRGAAFEHFIRKYDPDNRDD